MLELGLGRISRLLANSHRPWKAIHVAGTNGKGSVCAYLSALLGASGVSNGQFSTPHLIDRWDCISLNGQPIKKFRYDAVTRDLELLNRRQDIRATEFEMLTATAFNAFTEARVDVGVVEVGLGGRLDATNVMDQPLATVITKIGMDHESWLGNTLEEIAMEKAAIMKKGSACIIDKTNPPNLHELFRQHAQKVQAGPLKLVDPDAVEYQDTVWKVLPQAEYQAHQRVNIAMAYEAAKVAWKALRIRPDEPHAITAIRDVVWPGRLQMINIEPLTGRLEPILLDGAHNPQSAIALGSYVDARLRRPDAPVTWVLAASEGKRIEEMLRCILRPGDNVVTTAYGPVEEMPWVKARAADALLADARVTTELGRSVCTDTRNGLQMATAIADGGPLVVAGSLYLVSDVLRSLRDENGETGVT